MVLLVHGIDEDLVKARTKFIEENMNFNPK